MQGDGVVRTLYCFLHIFGTSETIFRADRISQEVKALAAELDSLSSITRSHMGEGENRVLHVVL